MSKRPFSGPKDAGIYTAEGNVAGSVAAEHARKRQKDQEEFEKQKQKIQSSSNPIRQFQNANSTKLEATMKEKMVGLVTAEEFRKIQESVDEPEQESQAEIRARAKAERKARKKRLKEKKQRMATLSFVNEEEEQEEEELSAVPLSKKDPTVDTAFLPDKQRDQKTQQERERLEREWKDAQERLKQEPLEITYSYFDGSGHRKKAMVKKGSTIGQFLEQVRKDSLSEFRELSTLSADDLVYVKEDLMLPHDLTFYDLILSKARGKSGPLFCFDVHEDVRVVNDARVEKNESHPGKVVKSSWYERNKHIFPANRWEVFDPTKDYGKYTIKGKSYNHKK